MILHKSQHAPLETGVRYTQSAYGAVIPRVYGRCRVPLKMIWTGNFKAHKSNMKKGKSIKKGQKITTYSANFDFLLGFGPLRGVGSVWRNHDDWYTAPVGFQDFTVTVDATASYPGSNVTITNNPGPIVDILAVTVLVPFSASFNDYGAPAPFSVSGTTEKGLFSYNYPGPNSFLFHSDLFYVTEFSGYLDPGAAATVSYRLKNEAVPLGTTITLRVYYQYAGKITTVENGIEHVAAGPNISPLAYYGLEFEQPLGVGNEFSYPGGSAFQIIYPEMSGVGASDLDLGPSNTVPNFTVEARGLFGVSKDGDANPADILQDMILYGRLARGAPGVDGTNGRMVDWNIGPGFSVSWMWSTFVLLPSDVADNSDYIGPKFPPILADPAESNITLGLTALRTYCEAYGIYISGMLDSQRYLSDWLTDFCDIANCAIVWDGMYLHFVPRCEVSNSAGGYTYTAPTASGPIADLDDSVFLVNSKDDLAVTLTRTSPADAFNILPINMTNRASNYDPLVITVRDQADIFKRGAIRASQRDLPFINGPDVAIKVAWPLLRRSTLVERLTYSFKLPPTYVWLDSYDLVTLTDQHLGLDKTPVRITSIKETEDYSLEVEAEPFYYGAHFPGNYIPSAPTQVTVPLIADNTGTSLNASPGSVTDQIVFEPVAALNSFDNEAAIWIAACGSDPNYGGCAVWMSTDGGNTYRLVSAIIGNSDMGALAQDASAIVDPDGAQDFYPDLTESLGTLQNFTAADRDAFASLCYVAGGGNASTCPTTPIPYELIAYTNATLLAPNQYRLTGTTRRGVYGTPDVAHLTGSKFCFIDKTDTASIAKIPIDQQLIGKTLYFKLTAFNLGLRNEQDLSEVTAFTFTPTGISSLLSQLGYSFTPSTLLYQGRAGGWPGVSSGSESWTDPTKIYIPQPFVAHFATGNVTYSSLAVPLAIPGVPPEELYVTVYDPTRSGTGQVYIDTDTSRVCSPGYIYLGSLFVSNLTTGGATGGTGGQGSSSSDDSPIYNRTVFIPYAPVAGQTVFHEKCDSRFTVTFDENFGTSTADALDIPLLDGVFTIYKNKDAYNVGVIVGTVTFSAGNPVGVFSAPAVSYGPNDRMTIVWSGAIPATFARVGFVFAGTRQLGSSTGAGSGTGSTVSVSTTSATDGRASSSYSQQLVATGGQAPYTWAVTAGTLPPGVTLDSATGMISGTPTTAGSWTFTVTATDALGNSSSQQLTITVVDTGELVFDTASIPDAIDGQPYSFQLQASGGVLPYTWSTTSPLPVGLTLNASTGVISGTPNTGSTVPVSFAESLTVTDSQLVDGTFVQSTSKTELTANNTSAVPGYSLNNSSANAQPARVSLSALSTLFGTDAPRRGWHDVAWFGTSGHQDVGYISNSSHAASEVSFLKASGFDWMSILWQGPLSAFDAAVQTTAAAAQSGGLDFCFMYDVGAFNYAPATQATAISDLQAAESKWFSQTHYLKIGGRPVVMLFGLNSYTFWATVKAALTSNPIFIFQDRDGYLVSGSDGSFAWVHGWSGDAAGTQLAYLADYYATAAAHPSKIFFGAAWKGFNDTGAFGNPGPYRIIDQQSGQTLVDTAAAVAGQTAITFMQLVSGTDYEEGTAIEPGERSSIVIPAAVMSAGPTASWSPTGYSGWIDHYEVYVAQAAYPTKLMLASSIAAGGTLSFDLSTLHLPTNSYVVYLYAVGKALFQNILSPSAAFSI